MSAGSADPPPEMERLRDVASSLVMACLDLLPVEGSHNRGYMVSESVQGRVSALPEEWATAAFHLCETHEALECLRGARL